MRPWGCVKLVLGVAMSKVFFSQNFSAEFLMENICPSSRFGALSAITDRPVDFSSLYNSDSRYNNDSLAGALPPYPSRASGPAFKNAETFSKLKL
jgi:hypothetical protein